MKPLSLADAAAMQSAEVAEKLAAIPVVPALADAFRATQLDAGDWALAAGVAFAPAVVAHALRSTGRAWAA